MQTRPDNKQNPLQETIRKLFICECGDPSHQFVIQYFPNDPDFDELVVDVLLNENVGFFGRIWNAIKYVIGRKSKFGAFDEILLSRPQVLELRKSLDEYLAR